MRRFVRKCADGVGLVLQGRGFLTGSITKLEDIPEQQRSFNPRMAEENFHKVYYMLQGSSGQSSAHHPN